MYPLARSFTHAFADSFPFPSFPFRAKYRPDRTRTYFGKQARVRCKIRASNRERTSEQVSVNARIPQLLLLGIMVRGYLYHPSC